MPLSVAAACSSKLKERQKRLAQRQPPRAVDARAERRVQHQLHAAALVEEALGDDRRRSSARRRGSPCRHARTRRPARRRRGRARTPRSSHSHRRGVVALVDGRAHGATLRARARSCAPVPRRSRTESTAARRARLPRARRRLRRGGSSTSWCRAGRCRPPCFRSRSLRRASRPRALGLDDDVVVGRVGNRAAAGDRGQPRAAAATQPAVHAIVVQERAAAPARRGDAVGQHRNDRVEIARARGRDRDRLAHRSHRARRRPIRRCAHAATICCARMSSGARGIAQRVERAARESRAPAPRTRGARRAW